VGDKDKRCARLLSSLWDHQLPFFMRRFVLSSTPCIGRICNSPLKPNNLLKISVWLGLALLLITSGNKKAEQNIKEKVAELQTITP
jgi:hypothetical protein